MMASETKLPEFTRPANFEERYSEIIEMKCLLAAFGKKMIKFVKAAMAESGDPSNPLEMLNGPSILRLAQSTSETQKEIDAVVAVFCVCASLPAAKSAPSV
jgi:hypothetical protein